ncbi:hydroxyethylthiazole kinase [Desulfovibrio ferrophilus]|uniref:Hydroxyethylthiazole kinase n=1 Tax=Desulfovibrio ferrophilus TaxID=241368 RepID=A0A2Z6AZE9_9BACT|nr:hydroxyethylthiazole kinase [Desulfovibrio ferrophilus]BBD08563.1 hydroxyethylthiazole kinase [Desulfovibrio ferrophilus]
MTDISTIFENLEEVRATTPLVHNITNFVVMNTTANALLALGASPIMAHAPEEMDDLIGIVGGLVINIGTLRGPWIESMIKAGTAASERGIPVVFDPVGAGASRLRTDTAVTIMNECNPTILRGNASEILTVAAATGAADKQRVAAALAAAGGANRGVDSTHSGEGISDVASDLANEYGCTVIISGPSDTITDGDSLITVTGGHNLMTKVTGMGCTASALCGAFAVTAGDPFDASVSAMAVMSAAGAVAAAQSQGPGTLQMHFYDALHNLTREQLEQAIELEWM